MRTRLATAALLSGLMLTACSTESSDDSTPAPATTTAGGGKAPAQSAEPTTATLPDLAGKSLQDAQDTAQAAGFWTLTSSDATGMERMQVLDRNWKVCSQTPAAGEHPTTVTVNFEAVKLDESC